MTGGLLESFLAGDSTELLVQGATSWAISGPLPSPRQVLRAVTLDNKIFVTGTYSIYRQGLYDTCCTCIAGGVGNYDGNDYPIYDDILELDKTERVWKNAGAMSVKRYDHAVSAINYNSILEYCN